MCTPSLMVMYTSDAVEVRYNDGSCLQVSPCGTTIQHHDKLSTGQHPVTGLRKIQKRCRFITSEYRSKVLQAMDFRNRFAERPYLCEELMNKEDIVALYADIAEVSWPESVSKTRCEQLLDGGLRIFSCDEFASLSISPHRRDFTVCYLSQISQDPVKNKANTINRSFTKHSSSLDSSSSSSKDSPNTRQNRSQDQTDKHYVNGNSRSSRNNGSYIEESTETGEHIKSLDSGADAELHKVAQHDEQCHRISTPTNYGELDGRDCGDNSNLHSLQSHKRIDCGVETELPKHDQQNRRISTPTNFGELDGRESGDNSNVHSVQSPMFNRCAGSNDNSPTVHEISSISRISSDGLCMTLDLDVTVGHLESPSKNKSPVLSANCSKNSNVDVTVLKSSMTSDGLVNSSDRLDDCQVSRAQRRMYTWVTRHISCNECPTRWKHALKLAEKTMHPDVDGEILTASPKSSTKVTTSQVPLPLRLSCPSQHRHKWAPVEEDYSEEDRVNAGRLKVMMVDGIIYRLIQMSSIKLVEIYPGDGTVFTSQGVKGQFFSHIISSDGRLEERTYSIRTLPPRPQSARYSLEKVLKRASRLLCEAQQRECLTHTDEQPCWQVEPSLVVEPLSVSVLEEVCIPGSGRFTAHTNGRVRVVFEDRTFLDTVCNFSQRVSECILHSSQNGDQSSVTVMTALDNEIDHDMCRLLLPSGKYVFVNKQKPGAYKRYVDQVLEWASWVNSSPIERKQFYEKLALSKAAPGSAAAEIHKITCLNYILENTVLRPVQDGVHNGNQSPSSLFRPDAVRPTAVPVTSSNMWRYQPIGGVVPNGTNQMMHVVGDYPIRRQVLSGSNERTRNMMDGFSSVRHALLQTNKLIQDIDEILDKK